MKRQFMEPKRGNSHMILAMLKTTAIARIEPATCKRQTSQPLDQGGITGEEYSEQIVLL